MSLFGGSKRRQFEQLARPLLRPLYQTALRLTRQTEWAEDLTQDTLVRAYERFEMFAQGTNFRAWLFTIMTHIYLNDCDRAKRRPVLASLHNGSDSDETWDFPSNRPDEEPETALLIGSLSEGLQAALDSLQDDFRLPIVLIDLEEMSYQEAADAIGIPVGTVRSRLSRGRAMLRKFIESRSLPAP